MIATVEAVSSRNGIITAPDARAAAAGVKMLEQGGNAFDAAIATAFAIGVVEPFMSGIGGGAWITARLGGSGQRITIEGPLVSPRAAHSGMFTLTGDAAGGVYGWPAVVDDANIVGPLSIATPGNVAALGEASAFGRLGLAQCLEPAIWLAENGTSANWLTTSCIVSEMRALRRDAASSRLFLPDGIPLCSDVTGPADVLVQAELGATLRRIAEHGVAEMYTGTSARAIASFVQASGGILDGDDFARYNAVVDIHPQGWDFDGFRVTGPMRTGVATVVQTLRLLDELRRGHPGVSPGDAAARWARALDAAMSDRLTLMAADPQGGTNWDDLLSSEHATQLLEAPPESATGQGSGCTSHITAADSEGTVVSLTQTVLSLFGSRMVEPSTGVLLNDGMMYFDPRAGTANEVRSSSPGLSAVSPVVIEHAGGVVGLGASGGRRIMSCVAQLVDSVINGSSPQVAIEAPRMHCENGTVVIDPRWVDVSDALTAAGFGVEIRSEQPTTWHYARPNGVALSHTGVATAGVDPYKPYGMIAARPSAGE